MKPRILIKNAGVVTCDEVIENASVFIEDGLIKDIKTRSPAYIEGVQVIDANGTYLLPGFIDLHCDALENEIQPRPNSLIPVELAFRHAR